MRVDIEPVLGLVFIHPATSIGYGEIRRVQSDRASAFADVLTANSFAEDGCGNAFVVNQDGTIGFWDHETDDITFLAASWPEFVQGCHSPKPVEMDEKQVISVWVDPDFARKMGLQTPDGG